MKPQISFRAATGLVVAAYAVIAGVLVAAAGNGLGDPISGYVPQMSWLTPETTAIRIAALKGAGLTGTPGLYALVAALSHGLMAAMAAGGFCWGVLNRGETIIGVDKSVTYVSALAALYALATVTEVGIHSVPGLMESGGISALPVLWFATMIPSAAILARIFALIAHDAGSLLIAAVDAPAEELARRAAAAADTRGADSLEASLARAMTRMPDLRLRVAAYVRGLAKRTAL